MSNINNSDVEVNFSNHNYSFMSFHFQHKTNCEDLSKIKINELSIGLKKVRSYMYEYLPYVTSDEMKNYFISNLRKIKENLSKDKQYYKLSSLQTLSTSQKIELNKMFFNYLLKIFKLIGLFNDELSNSYLPNLSNRQKLLRYSNTNTFYEQFTYYKTEVSNKLSGFSLNNWKSVITYFIGFYFAYYLYIDEKSRVSCEKSFSLVLSLLLNSDIVKMVENTNNLTPSKKEELRNIDFKLHDSLLNIFFRVNYSYSEYGIIPKITKKTIYDVTTI